MNLDETIVKANEAVKILAVESNFLQLFTKEESSCTNGEYEHNESLAYMDNFLFSSSQFKHFSYDTKFKLKIDETSVEISAFDSGMSTTYSKTITCSK